MRLKHCRLHRLIPWVFHEHGKLKMTSLRPSDPPLFVSGKPANMVKLRTEVFVIVGYNMKHR